MIVRLLFIFFCSVLSGCASYKVSTQTFSSCAYPCDPRCEDFHEIPECNLEEEIGQKNKESALRHPLYQIIPRHRCQIRWFDLGHWMTWMLFGNDDDGIFGEEPSASYRIDQPNHLGKAISWMIRNPLHNFCFYVIGSAHCRNSELTIIKMTPCQLCFLKYEKEAKTVFAGKGAGFFLGLHGWKPFVSMRLMYGPDAKSEAYLGWRCRGNFGAKLIPFTRH